MPDDPEVTFASMGNYIFTTDVLIDALKADADDGDSDHDMGGDIIPRLVGRGRWRTSTTSPRTRCPAPPSATRGYWRDVGTIDAYYEAHTDLVSVHPIFNLYNQRWPIRTAVGAAAARQVRGGRDRAGLDRRRGHASSPGRSCAVR